MTLSLCYLFFLHFHWEEEQSCQRPEYELGQDDLLSAAPTITLLCDVLLPRYGVFIKRSYRYKQENAIVPSRKWNRNTGGLQTMGLGSPL